MFGIYLHPVALEVVPFAINAACLFRNLIRVSMKTSRQERKRQRNRRRWSPARFNICRNGELDALRLNIQVILDADARPIAVNGIQSRVSLHAHLIRLFTCVTAVICPRAHPADPTPPTPQVSRRPSLTHRLRLVRR